jgi:hypothetical protein
MLSRPLQSTNFTTKFGNGVRFLPMRPQWSIWADRNHCTDYFEFVRCDKQWTPSVARAALGRRCFVGG